MAPPSPSSSNTNGPGPAPGVNARSGGSITHSELSPLVTTKPTPVSFAPTTTTIPEHGDFTTPNTAPSSSSAAPMPPTPSQGLRKADTDLTWGPPAGLHMRGVADENLRIFRTAVGINAHMHHAGLHGGGSSGSDSGSNRNGKSSPSLFASSSEPAAKSPYNCAPDLEGGRKSSTGVYSEVLRHARTRSWQHHWLSFALYTLYFMQILFGAGLTALGPNAKDHEFSITCLGACNTIIAGLLALIKGQGLPERLRSDEVEFRRLRDWIEETEALLAVGVLGRDRKEVGVLVETAFRKYNAAKQSEDDNKPEVYVSARVAEDEDSHVRKMK